METRSRRIWQNVLATAVWFAFVIFAAVMIYKIAVGIHF